MLCLDKPVCTPGELISGKLCLNFVDATKCSEITIEINGEEQLMVQKVGSGKESTFAPGETSLPFSCKLPTGLPCSINTKWATDPTRFVCASIKYTVTATAQIEEIDGSTEPQVLTDAQPLFLFSPEVAVAPAASSFQKYSSKSARSALCCLPMGKLQLNAVMAKSAHIAGDSLEVSYQVDGSYLCSVRQARVELIEEVTGTVNVKKSRDRYHVRKRFATQVVPRPKNRSQKLQTVSLKLMDSDNKPVNPTITGHYFEIKHFVRITCKPLGCTQIKLYLPVVIAHKDAKPFEYAPSLVLLDPLADMKDDAPAMTASPPPSPDDNEIKPATTPAPVSPLKLHDGKPVAPDSITLDAPDEIKKDIAASTTPGADIAALGASNGVKEDSVASATPVTSDEDEAKLASKS